LRGLEGALHNQIDLNPQQIGKPNLNADDVEKRKKLCLVQCGQQVDIGAGTGISSGGGTEQRQMCRAGFAQLVFVRAQCGEYLFAVHN
jgi:hypothetical protein